MSRSNKSYVKRHVKLISYLKVKPLSFDEIYNKLQNHLEDFTSYSLRTFQRDVKAIESLYAFHIKYNRITMKYELEENENNTSNHRMVESIELVDILSANSPKTVLLDSRKAQTGTERFEEILHAIDSKYKMRMNYKKFGEDKEKYRVIYPLAIKESRFRWYLIAEDETDHVVKTFAFDRITALSATEEPYVLKKSYDIEQLFQDYIGINRQLMYEKTRVVLETENVNQVYYLQSLPLHSSQKIEAVNEKKYKITFDIIITYDFILELMYMASSVKVCEPMFLVEEIQSELEKALALYWV